MKNKTMQLTELEQMQALIHFSNLKRDNPFKLSEVEHPATGKKAEVFACNSCEGTGESNPFDRKLMKSKICPKCEGTGCFTRWKF